MCDAVILIVVLMLSGVAWLDAGWGTASITLASGMAAVIVLRLLDRRKDTT